jgi:hypothetical protein
VNDLVDRRLDLYALRDEAIIEGNPSHVHELHARIKGDFMSGDLVSLDNQMLRTLFGRPNGGIWSVQYRGLILVKTKTPVGGA